MTLLDDRILEYLNENEAASPTEMKKGGPIKFSRAYIGRRCKKLKENGLIRMISDATYVITDDGEAYLEGRLDTQEWRYIHHGSEGADEQHTLQNEPGESEVNGGP
jgi:repressor of nif and glnA expression